MDTELSLEIKRLFTQLCSAEQISLLSELTVINTPKQVISSNKIPKQCPYCKNTKFIKHSFYNGTQRYKCKNCIRTFSLLTGSVFYHLKDKDGFIKYLDLVKEHGLLTVLKTAKKLNISKQTSLDWGYKYLLTIDDKKEKFEGDVQGDDIWFQYSQKGRKGLDYSRSRGGTRRKGDNGFQTKVLVMADSNKECLMETIKIGRISKQDLILAVGDKFKKNQKLTTDKHASYTAFSKELNLDHVNFISKKHQAETGENVQYVNYLASQLKANINHVHRGVSTKHLNLYVHYYSQKKDQKTTVETLLKQEGVWSKFIHQEETYEKFIHQKSVRTYRCPIKRKWKSQAWT